jgi:hypothetical protein
MPAETLKCPQCGGGLELRASGQPEACSYCGTQSVLPESARKRPVPVEIADQLRDSQIPTQIPAVAGLFAKVFSGVFLIIFILAFCFIAFVFITIFKGFSSHF